MGRDHATWSGYATVRIPSHATWSGDATETEAVKKLEEIIPFLKKHLYIHSLKKAQPITLEVKTGKEILFEFDDKYWEDYYEELVKIGEEEFQLIDEAKEREGLKKEKASKVQEEEIVVPA